MAAQTRHVTSCYILEAGVSKVTCDTEQGPLTVFLPSGVKGNVQIEKVSSDKNPLTIAGHDCTIDDHHIMVVGREGKLKRQVRGDP